MEKMKSFGAMIKLEGSNWQVWKSKMEDILYCKDLHDPIEGDEAKPEKMTDKEWEKQHQKPPSKIPGIIMQNLTPIMTLQLDLVAFDKLESKL